MVCFLYNKVFFFSFVSRMVWNMEFILSNKAFLVTHNRIKGNNITELIYNVCKVVSKFIQTHEDLIWVQSMVDKDRERESLSFQVTRPAGGVEDAKLSQSGQNDLH